MSREHRYLVITELFLPTKGGTAVWFDEVYRRLGGKEVHIVTAKVSGSDAFDANHPNCVHRLVLRRHKWLRPESLAMYGTILFKCLSLVRHHRFVAVHAGRVLPEGLIGWIVARLIRKPLIVYAHGEELTTWRQLFKFRTMSFVFCHADHVIANSEFTKGELLKVGVPSDRIAIIYPGVDLERFQPGLQAEDLKVAIGLESEDKLILSVGRLSRRKGFDQVIRAVPAIKDRGISVQYAIIGIGEDEHYLRNLAVETGVDSQVHFLGHVPAEDLPRWYNAADVFAMPNRDVNGDTEGFGIVFIEAAACGKPAVAGLCGGTGSAIVDGITGIRVNGAVAIQVADALIRLCEDSITAKEMGRNGWARAREVFSWDRVADKTVLLCE